MLRLCARRYEGRFSYAKTDKCGYEVTRRYPVLAEGVTKRDTLEEGYRQITVPTDQSKSVGTFFIAPLYLAL